MCKVLQDDTMRLMHATVHPLRATGFQLAACMAAGLCCDVLTLLMRPLKRTSSAFSCWTLRASSSWQPSLSCRSCSDTGNHNKHTSAPQRCHSTVFTGNYRSHYRKVMCKIKAHWKSLVYYIWQHCRTFSRLMHSWMLQHWCVLQLVVCCWRAGRFRYRFPAIVLVHLNIQKHSHALTFLPTHTGNKWTTGLKKKTQLEEAQIWQSNWQHL